MNETSSTRDRALSRNPRKIIIPSTGEGDRHVANYYGDLTFDYRNEPSVPDQLKKDLDELLVSQNKIKKSQASQIAKVVFSWALKHGCTHYCHWFQPLTGATAEKHDGFIDLESGKALEKFSAGELTQGEPDASSFPNGGARSTFEARGYTSWDISSPFFIIEGLNGSTLCIPTAFVAYHGEALDIKTPLLRANNVLSREVTKFLNLAGKKGVHSITTCVGPEQEYFLVDRAFYYSRPDLVMTGKTLIGRSTAKNQQLDDHYFGSIPQRVKNFMDELNYELHRLGVPAKTQHNEVAPGQFEIAPIFEDANRAADHNQIMMSTIDRVAERHDLKALLHEKPFPGINGSGKHVNWSLATNEGENLLSPSDTPHKNYQFLAIISIILEAVYRRSDVMRMSIASHGNDHRLGANEAPPSIISVFLGAALGSIFEDIKNENSLTNDSGIEIDLGAAQLAGLSKDDTDRNRTSPFAFTGNKFEFRAVGSSHAIGLPLTILNGAVAEVFKESSLLLEKYLSSGKSIEEGLLLISKHWLDNCYSIIFNGDNYSQDWVEEAAKRGLPNLKTSADALSVLKDKKRTSFLSELGILNELELKMRHNAFLEKYITCRSIEFSSLNQIVYQHVIPSAINYKKSLLESAKLSKELGVPDRVELEIGKNVDHLVTNLNQSISALNNGVLSLGSDEEVSSQKIAHELVPLSEKIGDICNDLEGLIPSTEWTLPTYLDLLFIR
jgi:glutamine synthetase